MTTTKKINYENVKIIRYERVHVATSAIVKTFEKRLPLNLRPQ